MRSWRSRGWPLSRPEAPRLPPPSSLPLTAEWPGGTRVFPRWRERSRCTCAHETLPLGGTVRVPRPRPVSWQPLSRLKLIALQARQPPPCTPWLSCRFTKPRRSNRCTRVVPTGVDAGAAQGDWLRSTSDESHGAVPWEGHGPGKEQRLGYLQQRCTLWSRWAPKLANLRWGGRKVATSCMAFVCHALACQHLHATRLWRGSAFHRTPMSSRHNS